MGIGKNTFDELYDAKTMADLDRLDAFSRGGDQDDSNNQLRSELARKREQLKSQLENEQRMKEETERANQIRGQLTQQATDYRSKLPQLQQQMFNPVADQSRRELGQQMRGINTVSNQRGLLYSGMRKGAQAEARGNMSAGLAAKRAQINANTTAQADAYDQAAVGGNREAQDMAMQQAQQKQQRNDQNYAQALERRKQRMGQTMGMANAAGQSVGSVAGALAGKMG